MLKRVFKIFSYFLLALLPALYLYFATPLAHNSEESRLCSAIEVAILDSSLNNFITRQEVVELIEKEGVKVGESRAKELNLYKLERIIERESAVKSSEVSLTGEGVLRVKVEQRRAIVRVETPSGGFYIDQEGVLLPLIKHYSSFVPIVTGEIELDESWRDKIYNLALFLDKNSFWSAMIEQIYIDKKGVSYLTPRVGEVEVILGGLENIEYKFRKLRAFYNSVVANKGWDYYQSVNLAFSSQLVSKKRER